MSAGTREGERLVDYQDQVVTLRNRVVELEGRLSRAHDAVAAAGAREAWMVEVLTHAHTWMSEDGCDCGTDEPGTCAMCEAYSIISSPRLAVAQDLHARIAELEAKLSEALSVLQVSMDFIETWNRGDTGALDDYDTDDLVAAGGEILVGTSPSVQALTRLVDAAREVVWRHWNPVVDRAVHCEDFMERMCELRDALLAARSGDPGKESA